MGGTIGRYGENIPKNERFIRNHLRKKKGRGVRAATPPPPKKRAGGEKHLESSEDLVVG